MSGALFVGLDAVCVNLTARETASGPFGVRRTILSVPHLHEWEVHTRHTNQIYWP